MLKIGLTGGIGCGKSTIAKMFNSNYNVPVIDADIITRQLIQQSQHTVLLKKIFGKLIFNADNSLNRDALKKEIFSDIKKKTVRSSITPDYL